MLLLLHGGGAHFAALPQRCTNVDAMHPERDALLARDSRGAAALYADLPSLATFSNGQFFVGAAAFRRRRAEIWPRAREWLFSETARRECPGSRRECTMLEHLWAAVLCEPCLSPPRHMDLRLPESLRVAPLAINTDPNAQTPSSATGPLWGHETRRPPRWRR